MSLKEKIQAKDSQMLVWKTKPVFCISLLDLTRSLDVRKAEDFWKFVFLSLAASVQQKIRFICAQR